jgi:hypothetical protein
MKNDRISYDFNNWNAANNNSRLNNNTAQTPRNKSKLFPNINLNNNVN